MKLSVVVPCYNEIDNLGKLRHELLPVLHQLIHTEAVPGAFCEAVELIVVDDGSRDGTPAALAATLADAAGPLLAIHIAAHDHNRGLGAALRTGLAASSGDVVVTTDSDGTYAFSTIPRLLGHLLPCIDVVTASPYHPAGGVDNVPGYRLVLSQGSSLIYRALVDRHIHTYTALFRAYRRRVITHVMHEADGFLGGTELLVKAILAGYAVAEYPTVLHARAHGVSKAKLWQTTRAHLRFQARILAYRLGIKSWPALYAAVEEQQ